MRISHVTQLRYKYALVPFRRLVPMWALGIPYKCGLCTAHAYRERRKERRKCGKGDVRNSTF